MAHFNLKRRSHTTRASKKRVTIDLTNDSDTEAERNHRSATIAPAATPTTATIGPASMTLYVKDLRGCTWTLHNVLPSWTPADIKTALSDQNNVPVALQRLIHRNHELTTAQPAGLTDGSVLQLVLKF